MLVETDRVRRWHLLVHSVLMRCWEGRFVEASMCPKAEGLSWPICGRISWPKILGMRWFHRGVAKNSLVNKDILRLQNHEALMRNPEAAHSNVGIPCRSNRWIYTTERAPGKLTRITLYQACSEPARRGHSHTATIHHHRTDQTSNQKPKHKAASSKNSEHQTTNLPETKPTPDTRSNTAPSQPPNQHPSQGNTSPK